jgi:2-C-methyl-D-erythritol 4-phosphate cytidylyltransferase
MIVVAVIVAAGRGTRMGAGRPKALLPVAGVPMLRRAAAAFAGHPRVVTVVAAVPHPDEARAALGPLASRVTLVRGGPDRQDSARLGIEAARDAALILVHDAARPLVGAALIDRVIEAAATHGAAVPALQPPDTVKEIDAGGAVVATVPRERLRLAQTPQGFRAALLREAHARAAREGHRATDDAALVEWAGGRVVVVEGEPRNLKITTPFDLALAEAILGAEDNRSVAQD